MPQDKKKISNIRSPRPSYLIGLAVFIAIIALLEIGARIFDSQYHFYDKVKQALHWIDLKTQPITADAQLSWPPKALYVRARAPHDFKQKPYVVGGRTIPGAYEKLKKKLIYPDHLKNDGRKRIFITGGSAAFGFPFLYQQSSGYLLQNLLGENDYHVINAAQISSPSGQLVRVVRRIVDNYEPNIIIIFTGNNEWTRWSPYTMPWKTALTVRSFKALSQSRFLAWILYRAFKKKSMHAKALYTEGKDFTIQKELEGFDYAVRHPFKEFFPYENSALMPSKNKFLSAFKENLSQMIDYVKKKNTRVIVLTVPFNYKLSVAFMHPQPICYNDANRLLVSQNIDKILSLLDQNKYTQAYELTQETLKLEPLIALLHYLKGVILEKTGKNLEAEEAYALSRENMIGHLGARLSINEAIRSVAKEKGVELIDLKKIFDEWEHARGSFYNQHLIADDCHPSPDGQRLIAATLYKAITDN